MKRVTIHGASGSGKSTLARNLSSITRLPVVHLDRIYWSEDWQERRKAEAISEVEAEVAKPRWIIEGIYKSSFRLRMERADTIIFLDYPRALLLWRVIRRVYKNRGTVQPDMPQAYPERFNWSFMKEVWSSTKQGNIRDAILQAIENAPASARIVHLRNDRQVREFLDSVEKTQATLPSS